MDGPIESPVPVVGRNAVVVTADRGSVWMIAIGNGDVERLDDGRHDFCADPAVISDRGMQVVTWQGWSVPDMPWDHSVQVRCDLDERSITVIAGKGQQQQITGSRHGVLSLRDDSGWLNVWCDETLLIADAAEHGGPSWGTSQRSFAISPDGEHLAFTRKLDGFGELGVYSFDAQKLDPICRGVHNQDHWGHGGITALRSGARTPNQLIAYQLERGSSPTDSERWVRTVLGLVRVKSGRRLNCLSPPVKKPLVMAPNLFSSLRRRVWTVSCTYPWRPHRPMAGRFCPELRIGSLRVGMSSFPIREVRPVTGARLLRRYMVNGAAPMLTMWLR